MSELDEAMLERMIHIVYDEHKNFSNMDFLDLMKPKTYRNKISKLKKDGIVELDYKSSVAFYTLKGHRFGKAGTSNHTAVIVTISHNDPIYNMIKNLPMDKQSIHDIHLKFKAGKIYKIFSDNTPYLKGTKPLLFHLGVRIMQ
jgi:DNA-binding transcriptional ArsR family regulator